MSDTPRTDQEAFYSDCEGTRYYCPQMGHCVSSDFARELERELANQKLINSITSIDWAHDHTHLQNLCREVGFSDHKVDGDKHGIPGIIDLGDMLRRRVSELEAENARLRVAGKALRDAYAFECRKLGDFPCEIDM